MVSAAATCDFQDTLFKRGGVEGKSGWKKRFFTLRNSMSTAKAPMFSYYTDAKARTPKGVIPLAAFDVSLKPGHDDEFELMADGRTYYLKTDASSKHSAKEWVQILTLVESSVCLLACFFFWKWI